MRKLNLLMGLSIPYLDVGFEENYSQKFLKAKFPSKCRKNANSPVISKGKNIKKGKSAEEQVYVNKKSRKTYLAFKKVPHGLPNSNRDYDEERNVLRFESNRLKMRFISFLILSVCSSVTFSKISKLRKRF